VLISTNCTHSRVWPNYPSHTGEIVTTYKSQKREEISGGSRNFEMGRWAEVDWLYIVLRPAQEYFTFMETSPLPVKGCKFRPMLGAQDLRAGRDLYRATPTVTRGLGFSGLIRWTAPISRLLRHTRGCRGLIQTRILTGVDGSLIKLYLLSQQLIWSFTHIISYRFEVKRGGALLRADPEGGSRGSGPPLFCGPKIYFWENVKKNYWMEVKNIKVINWKDSFIAKISTMYT
jgi:hypothetical protein